MSKLYLEILPQELLYVVNTKLISVKDIYNFIKLCKLNHDIAFKMLCDVYCPFLRKYGVYQEFRGRRIPWYNIFDMILQLLVDDSMHIHLRSLIGLSRCSSWYKYDYNIILLEEYSNKKCDDLESFAYEYRIYHIFRTFDKISGSLELYLDVIESGSAKFEDKADHIEKITCHEYNKLLTKTPSEIYTYAGTNFVIKPDEFAGKWPIAVGILECGKLRDMNDAEIIIATGFHHLSYQNNIDLTLYKIDD